MGLVIATICGFIAAAIAHNKGRSAVGWFFGGFFLNIIGIVIVACIGNLKEQKAYRRYTENEGRRLREQLRQERLKSEAYRQYSMTRLDSHDEVLGIDTRSAKLIGDAAPAGLLTDADEAALFQQPSQPSWYYERDGDTIGPVSETDIRHLLTSGTITPSSLVWTEGFSDWQALTKVDRFRLSGET